MQGPFNGSPSIDPSMGERRSPAKVKSIITADIEYDYQVTGLAIDVFYRAKIRLDGSSGIPTTIKILNLGHTTTLSAITGNTEIITESILKDFKGGIIPTLNATEMELGDVFCVRKQLTFVDRT